MSETPVENNGLKKLTNRKLEKLRSDFNILIEKADRIEEFINIDYFVEQIAERIDHVIEDKDIVRPQSDDDESTKKITKFLKRKRVIFTKVNEAMAKAKELREKNPDYPLEPMLDGLEAVLSSFIDNMEKGTRASASSRAQDYGTGPNKRRDLDDILNDYNDED